MAGNPSTLAQLGLVASAGALGAVARFGLTSAVQRLSSSTFPYGTLAVNILGCLAIGGVMYALEERRLLTPGHRLFLVVGFLGGFTTFSAIGYDTFAMLRSRHLPAALANIAVSVVAGLAAVAGGWYGARTLLR